MSAAVQPFAFDRVFVPAPPSHAVGCDPADLEAEIARLRELLETEIERARAEAFEAALAQARSDQTAALLAATDALQASLELLDERFDDLEEAVAADAAVMALAAADHLAGHAVALSPLGAIEEAIGRALQQVRRGTPLQIRVNPMIAAEVEGVIAGRQGRDRRKLHLSVITDAGIKVGDAQLVWDDGSLACSAEARQRAIAHELSLLFPAG